MQKRINWRLLSGFCLHVFSDQSSVLLIGGIIASVVRTFPSFRSIQALVGGTVLTHIFWMCCGSALPLIKNDRHGSFSLRQRASLWNR